MAPRAVRYSSSRRAFRSDGRSSPAAHRVTSAAGTESLAAACSMVLRRMARVLVSSAPKTPSSAGLTSETSDCDPRVRSQFGPGPASAGAPELVPQVSAIASAVSASASTSSRSARGEGALPGGADRSSCSRSQFRSRASRRWPRSCAYRSVSGTRSADNSRLRLASATMLIVGSSVPAAARTARTMARSGDSPALISARTLSSPVSVSSASSVPWSRSSRRPARVRRLFRADATPRAAGSSGSAIFPSSTGTRPPKIVTDSVADKSR